MHANFSNTWFFVQYISIITSTISRVFVLGNTTSMVTGVCEHFSAIPTNWLYESFVTSPLPSIVYMLGPDISIVSICPTLINCGTVPVKNLSVISAETELSYEHEDVMNWKHFPRYWFFVRGIHRSPGNSPHKALWRGGLVFTLIYAWTNGWVNNRDAGDLRRHRANYDVIVMDGKKVLFWVRFGYFINIMDSDDALTHILPGRFTGPAEFVRLFKCVLNNLERSG